MVTKKQVEEVEVEEMRMVRLAMGVIRKDKIRNQYIRGTVKVKQLGTKLMEGKLRWYGHVMRRDQEYVGRRWSYRKRGKPKRRFLDVLKEDMGKVGAREKDIENRTLWRNIICCGNP